jgi:hypothetical protein
VNLRELVTKIGFVVDDQGLRVYDNAIGRIYEKAKGLNSNLTRAADNLIGIGQKMSLYISAPLAALATVSVMAKVKLEDLQNEWGVMLGNQEKGIAFTKDMMTLEEKGPYEYEQIHAYAKEMHAMGVESDKILPRVKLFMDIAAGSGLDLGFLMSTMQMIDNIGFATGRQVKRLIMSGALDRGTLGKMLGVNLSSGTGMKQMMKMADMGKITASMIESVFQKEGGQGGRYFVAAEQRTHTLKKGFDNLWHSIFLFRAGIGDAISKSTGLSRVLEKLTEFVDKMTDRIDKLSPGWKKFLVITGGVVFAIGPAIMGLGKMLKLFIGLNSALQVMKFSGFLKDGAGIAGMFGGIAKGLWAAVAGAAPFLLLMSSAMLIIQDLWMYLKYGDKANTLTGELAKMLETSKNPVIVFVNGMMNDLIQTVVNFFFKIGKLWDDLWKDPWKALNDLVPQWIVDLITMGIGSKEVGAYKPSPSAFGVAGTTMHTNVEVKIQSSEVGSAREMMANADALARKVAHEVNKKQIQSIERAHRNVAPAMAGAQ